jgi:hypothetical protein
VHRNRFVRFAAACGIASVAVAGLTVSVAQGRGGRQATWVTFQETWVLKAGDDAVLVLPPAGAGTDEESGGASPEARAASGAAPEPGTSADLRAAGRPDDDGPADVPPDAGIDPASFFPPAGARGLYTDGVFRSTGRGFRAGERIGDEGGTFEFGLDRALVRASYDIWDRGTIEVAFSFSYADEVAAPTDPAPPFQLAILGGTGDFAGISGTITVYDETDARDPEDTLGKAVIDAVLPRR